MLLGFYTYFLDAISTEYQQIGTTLPRGGANKERESRERALKLSC